MRWRHGWAIAALSAVVCCGTAQAHIGYSANCASCHTATTGRLAVTGNGPTTSLTGRLDGGTTAALDTYTVQAGQSITLSADITGSATYALVFEGWDLGGVKNSQSNHLSFPIASGWTSYNSSGAYYATAQQTTPKTLSFNMAVGTNTPADYYDVMFMVTGVSGSKFSQAEHFYINVTPAPEPSAGMLLALGGAALTLRRRSA